MAVKLMEEYVTLPNSPNGEWRRNVDIPTNGDQVSVKVDHKLSQSNTVSVRFYRDYTKEDEVSQQPVFTSFIGNEVRSWSFTDQHVFGNGMVGEGRVSLSKVETLSELAPRGSGGRQGPRLQCREDRGPLCPATPAFRGHGRRRRVQYQRP
jgi:hypothetical protein